ncbi:hypothetical protein TWF281_001378 [Arthrobotrys megalospora]
MNTAPYTPYLPPEVVRLIAKQINDKQTLSRFCRTCRTFNQSAQELLYETLEIKVDPKAGIDPWKSQALLHRNHSGLKYVKHFLVSGKFIGGEIQPELGPPEDRDLAAKRLHSLMGFQDLVLLCILRNIPPNTLRSFIWRTSLDLSSNIFELLCEDQKLINGLLATAKGGVQRLKFKSVPHPWNLKHLHLLYQYNDAAWDDPLLSMIQAAAPRLQTLSLTIPYLRRKRMLLSNLSGDEARPGSSGGGNMPLPEAAQIGSNEIVHEAVLFPELRYLSLNNFESFFLNSYSWFKNAENSSTLQVLKLINYKGIDGLRKFLEIGKFKLKTLHFGVRYYESGIAGVLGAFDSLEELLLTYECGVGARHGLDADDLDEPGDDIARAICNHKHLKCILWSPDGIEYRPEYLSLEAKAFCAEALTCLEELCIPEPMVSATTIVVIYNSVT